MRLLKNLFLGLIALVVLLALVSFALPRVTVVARSTVVDAPASAIFPYVNSMQATQEWSPWLERDPNVQLTYEGPESGVGNKMTWASEVPNVGNGTQEIVASSENARVDTALDFGEQGLANATFLLEPEGDGTKVTWTLETDAGFNPMARYFGLLLDGFVGPDYEKGLANLKAIAEG